jgi:hypothetical protein
MSPLIDNAADVVKQIIARREQIRDISLETGRRAGDVMAQAFHTLVESEASPTRELVETAADGFRRVRAEGFKAFTERPADFLPNRYQVSSALSSTAAVLLKTGDELFGTVRSGFNEVGEELKRPSTASTDEQPPGHA